MRTFAGFGTSLLTWPVAGSSVAFCTDSRVGDPLSPQAASPRLVASISTSVFRDCEPRLGSRLLDEVALLGIAFLDSRFVMMKIPSPSWQGRQGR